MASTRLIPPSTARAQGGWSHPLQTPAVGQDGTHPSTEAVWRLSTGRCRRCPLPAAAPWLSGPPGTPQFPSGTTGVSWAQYCPQAEGVRAAWGGPAAPPQVPRQGLGKDLSLPTAEPPPFPENITKRPLVEIRKLSWSVTQFTTSDGCGGLFSVCSNLGRIVPIPSSGRCGRPPGHGQRRRLKIQSIFPGGHRRARW